MSDATNTPLASQEMVELIAAVRSLSGLKQLLQKLLEMESQPGVSDRIQDFIAEIEAVRAQIARAATAMEAALPAEERLSEIRHQQEEQGAQIARIAADLSRLSQWLGQPPRGAGPVS